MRFEQGSLAENLVTHSVNRSMELWPALLFLAALLNLLELLGRKGWLPAWRFLR